MQNNVGLQTAYWSGTTPALDIHQIIELTKKANMDTIELKAGDFVPLTTEGRAALRKEIEDAGLSITINGTGLRPEKMYQVLTKNLTKQESNIYAVC